MEELLPTTSLEASIAVSKLSAKVNASSGTETLQLWEEWCRAFKLLEELQYAGAEAAKAFEI